jgi:hypothetical protein
VLDQSIGIVGSAASVSLPALGAVCSGCGGECAPALDVTGSNLTSLQMPVLKSINGYFNINNNAALTQVEFPLLTGSGNLEIIGNSVLKSLSMPMLTGNNCQTQINDNPCLSEAQVNAFVTEACSNCGYCATFPSGNGTMTCP